jgi:hypothetical protein
MVQLGQFASNPVINHFDAVAHPKIPFPRMLALEANR